MCSHCLLNFRQGFACANTDHLICVNIREKLWKIWYLRWAFSYSKFQSEGFMELMEFNEASLSWSWVCLTLVQRRTGSLSTGRRALWPMPKSKVLSLSRNFCILVGRYSVISIFRGEGPEDAATSCSRMSVHIVTGYLQTSQIVTSVLTAL